MPLRMLCVFCGAEVFVKRIDDEQKAFVFTYDCAKCGKIDITERIDKTVCEI